jgi:hypothetical protein
LTFLRRFSPTGVCLVVFAVLLSYLRSRAALQIEVLALRHQLTVLQRSVKRPRLTAADQFLWAWLAHVWRDWRAALVIVQPETVIGWAPPGLPLVLDVESAPRAIWTTQGCGGGARTHPPLTEHNRLRFAQRIAL